MNLPISWLRDITNIDDTTENILAKMTDAGLEVATLERPGADITGVVVGQIKSLERHPDADKLWVTQTDIGSEVKQIVTGADNLKVGDYIPVAIHGTNLANGLKIKNSKMRGVDSNGMLCSIGELGLSKADFPNAPEDGIYVFDQAYPLGSDVKPIMQIEDEVADIEILSNRPDTNSVMGLAREVMAAYDKAFMLPEIKGFKDDAHAKDIHNILHVAIKDEEKCPRYIGRVVKNVKIGPSPQWLRRRLAFAGINPINNIVDITNYVMLEYGQPLHAFDARAVSQQDGQYHIVVRTAHNDDVFTTLDGGERNLSDKMLMIADHKKIIGIAGIMGGENSMITDDTTEVLFESANFDSANIRNTARSLGMRTDASARYEKGQDPEQALRSMNRAMELVCMLACGDIVPGMVDVYPNPSDENVFLYDANNINKRLGVSSALISADQVVALLERVGIRSVHSADSLYMAHVPSFRKDVTGEADLAEEVARFYGLNNIPANYTQVLKLTDVPPGAGRTPRRRREYEWKRALTGLGYYEALTYPFDSPKVFDKLNLAASDPLRTPVVIKNPISEEHAIMRSVPMCGLLEAVSENIAQANKTVSLFEIATTFHHHASGIEEKPVLTIMATDTDFLSFKGDIEALLTLVAPRAASFVPNRDISYMHPGRTADVLLKVSPNPRDAEHLIGYIGELHPQAQKNFNIGARVYLAVLDVALLHELAEAKTFKFVAPSVFPAITRDIAVTVKDDISSAALKAAILEKAGPLLVHAELFDVYQGPQVGDGMKSMAYALTFRANDRTLTIDDVNKPIQGIIKNLEDRCDAVIRG